MIGRGPFRSSRLFAAGLLTALLLGTSLGAHPAPARAAGGDPVDAPSQTPAQAQATPSPQPSPTPAPDTTPSASPSASWIRDEKHVVPAPTIRRFNYSMAPGTHKTIARGAAGERDTIVRYTQNDDGSVQRWVVASHVTRKPHPRIVAIGIDERQAFVQLEARGVMRMSQLAASAMHMVATAYTANCAGCGGVTASGRPAGRGVVAVDPRIIPLGTHLFIPGYGPAVAGDTGGAIHGLRIDLGFNSLREAMLFGRREITVYRLK